MELALQHFDQAKYHLAIAKDIDEVKQVRDQAEALRQYIRQQGASLEMQNQCAEIKLRAERRAGEMLGETELSKGGEWEHKEHQLHDVTGALTLEDLGISKIQSHRWQLEAGVPEEQFEQWLAEIKARKEELTSVGLRNLALINARETALAKLGNIKPPEGQFLVIAVDPPWPYGGSYKPDSHRVASPYPEMSVDELMSLNIPSAPDCILWLWTTNAFMHDAYHLLEAWGFEPKTILTWFKEKIGVGYWLRGETEHCLLATSGKPKISHEAQSTHLKVKAYNHSAKPDEFYELVESLCGDATEQTHLEMFARIPQPNWAVWGNEVSNE